MKTAEEYLLEQFGCAKKTQLMTEHFIGLTVINGVLEVMQAYAREACREQREICAAQFNEMVDSHNHNKVKNAPEPKMI